MQADEGAGQEMETMVEEEDKDEPKMEDYDTELHVEEPGIVYSYSSAEQW